MFDRLQLMQDRYNEITNLLTQQEIISDIKEMTKLLKEQKGLEKPVLLYKKYKETLKTLDELEVLMDDKDKDIQAMAQAEYEDLKETVEPMVEELKILLLPTDPHDDKNVIFEIKGATGGDEANIFAGDLFRMYTRYAESNGWTVELLNVQEGTMGGFTSVEFLVNGEGAYSKLKYEAGVHRVQRVPLTESQGRIHTSTATVIVMPEVEELDIELSWNDIKVDVFFSSGPGGQSVNTTASAVRLTHLPTGIVVSCQEGKSQHGNKEKAYKILAARVYDKFQSELDEKLGEERLAMVGRGKRSEKIRTYNYPQNRVSDHRINLTIQRLDAIMDGKLDLVIEPLINEDQKRLLQKSGN
ncbi:MAG: peptide chain release factor 1 [Acholeplasmatales bacterium]|jgi:peptide chain release factor 1|nr:peptide chain release factor 1 [Acholeplasmatales bacterium]